MINHQDRLINAIVLSRYYSEHCAVNNVDVVLHKGEVLGLLGPNGAGKSTTMQMLTGNLSPSAGEIQINGIDLLDEPRNAKQQMGYLPEQPPVYRDLTVSEYLHYCARLRNVPSAQRKGAVATASERCGLQDVSKRLIGNLSKGFRQRVGIAQAILHNPAVVILDEPTVGLDPIQIREIRSLIRELGKEHGIILSTHILPEVQAVCDRVQILNRGKTVFNDTLEGVESLEKVFFDLIFREADSAHAEVAVECDLGNSQHRIPPDVFITAGVEHFSGGAIHSGVDVFAGLE